MPEQTDVGLRAKLSPDIDEQETRRQVSRLGDIIQEGLGRQIGNMLSQMIPTRLGDVIGQSIGAGIGGNVGGGGGGGEGPTDRETGSSLVDLTIQQNELLEDIAEMLDEDFVGEGGGGGGGGAAGGAGSMVKNVLQTGGAAAAGAAGLAGTALGVTALGASGTGGLYMGARQALGPDRVDANTRQAEAAERGSTGLGPAWTATSPTGATGLGMTLAERLLGDDDPRDPAPEEDKVGSTRFPSSFQGLGLERGDGNDWDFDQDRGTNIDWSLGEDRGVPQAPHDAGAGGSVPEDLQAERPSAWDRTGQKDRGTNIDWSLGGSGGSGGNRVTNNNNVTVNQNITADMSDTEEAISNITERSTRGAMRRLKQDIDRMK